jgi:sterol 3beta-glucosyltransferase
LHITLLAYRSRGDVEPFVALGKGLLRAGYQVRLAAPAVFSSLVTAAGIDFVGLPGELDEPVQGLVDTAGRSPPRMIGAVSRFVVPLAARVFEAVQAACQEWMR